MEEILLSLICSEFEMEESFLFSNSQHSDLLDAISMMTYLFITEYGYTVGGVHKFYVSKGYNKTRPTLYGHRRRAHDNIRGSNYFRVKAGSLIEGVSIAKEKGMIIPTEDDIHSMKGRIMSKLVALKGSKYLSRVESQLDSYLKAEFINTTQFEEKTESWLT